MLTDTRSAVHELLPLSRLRNGQLAEIQQVLGQADQVHRLHELGLGDGTRVEMVQSGSPCIIRLGTKKLCFSRGGHSRSARATGSRDLTRLSDLPVGSCSRVVAIDGTDQISLRLLEMGLTPGVQVTLLGTAPWANPLELEVRGYRLSLRQGEAARVEVEDI